MKNTLKHPTGPGPFQADQLRSGDPYELSNGHAIYCMPTGGRGSRANLIGGLVLDSDPAVESAGFDTGFSPSKGTLRAPDVAVGNVSDKPGWVPGAPPLAVEYADTGQDEEGLAEKIQDLLGSGTKHVWVVRLTGPRRVEIHEPGRAMRLAHPGDDLHAPDVLRNPVPVDSLFEREAAHEVTLRNLLQRQGYESVDEIRTEGKTEGKAEGKAAGLAEGEAKGEVVALRRAITQVLLARGLGADANCGATIDACDDPVRLGHWLSRAAVVAASADVFSGDASG